MEYPKVSIISAFYNREDTIENSVQSLIDQNYPNLEIILIDDNSRDNSLNILRQFEKVDSRVKVIHNNPNKGFTSSLIDTISDLDSKYIAIHGSGDISLPTRVATQVKFLEENCDVGVVTVGVTNRPGNNVFDKIQEITMEHLLKRNMINHGAVMFRSDKYLEAGGYRKFFTTSQDKDLWFRMALICKIYFLPDKLYTWVKQDSSVSNNSYVKPNNFLTSEFIKFLIKHQITYEEDLLAKDEKVALLLFNPTTIKSPLYKLLYNCMIRRKFKNAKEVLHNILLVENKSYKRFLLKIFISMI